MSIISRMSHADFDIQSLREVLQEPGPARTVGAYRLIALVGTGAFGAVYRACHVDNGREVAMKVLKLDARSSDALRRFRTEARILASLDHPAIVKVTDSGVCPGWGLPTYFLASEFVAGKHFVEALRGRPVSTILTTFLEVCSAVAYAHGKQVIHRDIKPSNILVDERLHAHLLDFGTAFSAAHRSESKTATCQVLGTPPYLSPEQARAERADARSDVWSLGALLFSALTGEPPHDVADLALPVALRRLGVECPKRLETLRPDLEGSLCAVVNKALAFEPEFRYQTVRELSQDLLRLLAGDPIEARPLGLFQALRRVVRRHRAAAALTFFSLTSIVAFAFAVTVLWRKAESDATALRAAASQLAIARQLKEQAIATELQTHLVEPMLAFVVEMQKTAGEDADSWKTMEAGLREALGDIALRARDSTLALRQRASVLALQRELCEHVPTSRSDLATALVKLGDLDSGPARDRAKQLYQEAHRIFLANAQGEAPALSALDDLSWSYHRLAGIARDQGRSQEAIMLAKAHHEIALRMLSRSDDPMRRFNLTHAISQLLSVQGCTDLAEQEAMHQLAVKSAEMALSAEPKRFAYMVASFQAHHLFASYRIKRGELGAAQVLIDRASVLADGILAADPTSPSVRGPYDSLTRLLAEYACIVRDQGPHVAEAARRFAKQAAERLPRAANRQDIDCVDAALRRCGLMAEADAVRTSYEHEGLK